MQIFMGGRGNGKTVKQTIAAISEGNPGCMQFCCELLSKEGMRPSSCSQRQD